MPALSTRQSSDHRYEWVLHERCWMTPIAGSEARHSDFRPTGARWRERDSGTLQKSSCWLVFHRARWRPCPFSTHHQSCRR